MSLHIITAGHTCSAVVLSVTVCPGEQLSGDICEAGGPRRRFSGFCARGLALRERADRIRVPRRRSVGQVEFGIEIRDV